MASIWDKAGTFIEDVATGGGGTKRHAAQDAARAQQKAIEEGKGYLTTALGQTSGQQQPYADMGLEQTRNLNDLLNNGGFDPGAFKTSAVMPGTTSMYEDPGYKFRMEQGNQALLASLAKGAGGQYSPAAAQKLMEYNQGLGSQEYQNMFNRQNTNYDNQFNQDLTGYNAARSRLNDRYQRLQNMSNMGQNAANNLSNIYSNYGSNMANMAADKGNVEAAKLTNIGNITAGEYGKIGQAAGEAVGGYMGGPAGAAAGGKMMGGGQQQPSASYNLGQNANQWMNSSSGSANQKPSGDLSDYFSFGNG
jgi:hypothetical protein